METENKDNGRSVLEITKEILGVAQHLKFSIKWNNGNIRSLADVDWKEVTNNWDPSVVDGFIETIVDDKMKLLVLSCMMEKYEIETTKSNSYNDNHSTFGVHCRALKLHIENADKYKNSNPMKGNSGDGILSHFNNTLPDDKLKVAFDNLIKGGYLDANSLFEDWLYICTGKGEKAQQKPLKWIAQQNELAVAVIWIVDNKIFKPIWQTTKACFVLRDDKPININAMKQHNISEKKEKRLLDLLNFQHPQQKK